MIIFGQGGTVTQVAPGRFDAVLSDSFVNPNRDTVNGGLSLAACVRALEATVAHPDPLVLSATYLRPVSPGPASVTVDPVRSGRRFSTAEARLAQNGSEAVRVIATFTDLSATTGRTHVSGEPPRLPPPTECVKRAWSASSPPRGVPTRTELRWPTLPGWISGHPSGEASSEFWMRLADGEVADVYALPSLVDMVTPAVFELGERITTTIELTVHVRGRPAPGWLACRVYTRYLIDGLHEEDFEIWDSAGHLVAQSRQLQLLN